MRVLIANPPSRLDDGKYIVPFPSRCDWVGDMKPDTSYYPYELAYLSSVLKRDGHEVAMMDGLTADIYRDLIRETKPDYFVTECGHLSYPTMTRVMRETQDETTIFILCGPFGTAYPDQAYADGWNVVIAGEFEHQISARLRNAEPPGGLMDLDSLPLPEDDDISRVDYWEQSCIRKPMIQIYATRGCPARCDFCTSPLYYGGYDGPSSHRTRNVTRVCNEIETLVDKYPQNKGFFFNDETHNARPRWLQSFCRELIGRGLDRFVYEAMCGYWTVTQADLELMRAAGYQKLRFGAESLGNEHASGERGKRVVASKLITVLEWCKAADIKVHLTSMIGTAGSTPESDLQSLQALLEIKSAGLAQTIQHSIATPNPGTKFAAECTAKGWILDGKAREWHTGAISYPNYSADEIERIAKAYYMIDRVQAVTQ